MYGALLRMSRSVGVLKAPGGTGAPGSSQPFLLGTRVLWSALSVNSGPPWQAMHAPLPWKSTSPRSAAGDIVPWSKLVVGGRRRPREAAVAPAPRAGGAAGCGAPVFEKTLSGWVARLSTG